MNRYFKVCLSNIFPFSKKWGNRILPVLLFFLSACGSGDPGENVVATYKDIQLNREELNFYLPKNVTKEDSARFSQYYIEQWLMEQAIADKARQEIENLDEKIEFKVRDYRQKLIIHEFTSHLIDSKMDTLITREELMQYYDANANKFISNQSLYSFFYFSTAERSLSEPMGWLRSQKEEDFNLLLEWCKVHALDFKLDSGYVNDTEISRIGKGYFGNLRKVNKGSIVSWTGVIKGEKRTYFFKMLSKVEEGEPMPIALTLPRIKSIILNDRKMKLVEDTEEQIMKEANAKSHIKIY